MDENELAQKLLEAFKEEAPGRLKTIRRELYSAMRAEKDATQYRQELIREAHNLKGGSRITNLTEIQSVCASMERVFRAVDFPPSKDIYDMLMQALLIVEELLTGERMSNLTFEEVILQLDEFAMSVAEKK